MTNVDIAGVRKSAKIQSDKQAVLEVQCC